MRARDVPSSIRFLRGPVLFASEVSIKNTHSKGVIGLIQLRVYILTADYPELLAIQRELILDSMRTVEAAGTRFAFP